jgi:cytochrome c
VKRLILLALLLAACNRPETPQPAAPPTPSPQIEQGKQVAARYGCGVCHVIPGVPEATGALGPSLAGVASRPTISEGVVQNTPANLTQYILKPGSMNPQSRMPPMGLNNDEAEAVTAFLMTLK